MNLGRGILKFGIAALHYFSALRSRKAVYDVKAGIHSLVPVPQVLITKTCFIVISKHVCFECYIFA